MLELIIIRLFKTKTRPERGIKVSAAGERKIDEAKAQNYIQANFRVVSKKIASSIVGSWDNLNICRVIFYRFPHVLEKSMRLPVLIFRRQAPLMCSRV